MTSITITKYKMGPNWLNEERLKRPEPYVGTIPTSQSNGSQDPSRSKEVIVIDCSTQTSSTEENDLTVRRLASSHVLPQLEAISESEERLLQELGMISNDTTAGVGMRPDLGNRKLPEPIGIPDRTLKETAGRTQMIEASSPRNEESSGSTVIHPHSPKSTPIFEKSVPKQSSAINLESQNNTSTIQNGQLEPTDIKMSLTELEERLSSFAKKEPLNDVTTKPKRTFNLAVERITKRTKNDVSEEYQSNSFVKSKSRPEGSGQKVQNCLEIVLERFRLTQQKRENELLLPLSFDKTSTRRCRDFEDCVDASGTNAKKLFCQYWWSRIPKLVLSFDVPRYPIIWTR